MKFLGPEFSQDRLEAEYGNAICSVSPGYVGLSMTQSHYFGVPMIYSRDEAHAPEVIAAREGFNAFRFDTDDVAALADAMVAGADRRESIIRMRAEIAAQSRSVYSFESMARGFADAVRGVKSADEGVSSE